MAPMMSPVLWSALAGTASAATTFDTTRAPVSEVVVYPDRAVVERSAKANLGAGVSEVVFTGLPSPLLDGSVRAQIDAKGAKVIALTVREEVHLEDRRAEVAELNAAIRKVQAEIRRLQVEDGKLAERFEIGNSLRIFSQSSASMQLADPSFDVPAFDRALDLYAKDQVASLGERSRLQAALQEQSEILAGHQTRLADLQYGRERGTTAVTVVVESDTATSGRLELEYGVGNVSWSPRYDLRFDEGKLNLSYQAEVRQSSGEDWEDTKLVFTTARPDEMVPPPENQPLYLSGYKEKETTVQLGSLREEAKDEEIAVAEATVGSTGDVAVTKRTLSVDLVVPHPASVPADGRPYRIAVLETGMKAEIDNWAAPALSTHLFLRARSANQSGIPLLAGPADVYRTSGYVGTLQLPDLATGEKLDLSLGPAGPFLVERDFDLARNRVVEHGMGRKKVHFVYDVEVHNFGAEAAEVVVTEALPVSRVEAVKVKVDPETTPATEKSSDESQWTWRLKVAAGAYESVHVAYVVDLPEDYAWEGF